MAMLMLEPGARAALWKQVVEAIEKYSTGVDQARVTPLLDPQKVRGLLQPLDFARPLDPRDAVKLVVDGLWLHQTHTPHPRYFGLFNPAPTTMGIAADALVAAFNQQVGAWGHNPLAVEIEQHLARAFGGRFGYNPSETDGTFTSGGSEANLTALLVALARAFPAYAEAGLRSLPAQPVFYVSRECHHSLMRAARLTGIGAAAVREVPVDARLRMQVAALGDQIEKDRRAGFAPFLVAATAGTTSAGAIDPLEAIADVAARERLWFHVDAAWGGAAALVPELRPLLDGIERADSIIFDPHKWLSVPMGAGLYLTRHAGVLENAFHLTTVYAPRDAAGLDVVDPYRRSIQWSRRFIGLKIFLSLLVAGWDGYAAALRHMVAMGDRLRRVLADAQWEIANETPLPLVCFAAAVPAGLDPAAWLEKIVATVVTSGRAWISTTRIGGHSKRDAPGGGHPKRDAPGIGAGRPVIRACITNYRTGPADVDALVEALNDARAKLTETNL